MTDAPSSVAESLLARVKEEGRARLRLYIGAAPGVGKSYRMLEDAHELRHQGVDVVIGFIEPHGRAETQALIHDLEQVPLRALEYRGVRVLVFDGPGGRTDLTQLPAWLAQEQYRSLMIESGSKLNWAVLESGIVDKIFFYYAPKILGGLQSLPVAGGTGRLRRTDAIQLHGVRLHSIPPDEFAVEGYVVK